MLEIRVKNEISDKLNQYIPELQDKLVQALGDASRIIIRTSVRDYMRDAGGEQRRRRKDDAGPLRIVSGRLARSLTGARKGGRNPESIYEVSIGTGEVRLRVGSLVPYSRVHELGIGSRSFVATRRQFGAIPARPYLGPAVEDEKENVRAIFERALIDLSNELGLS